jgi:serine protease
MNKKYLPLYMLSLVMGTAPLTTTAFADMPSKTNAATPAPPVNTDRLIIRFRDTASPVAVEKVLSRMRTEKQESFAYAKTTPDHADVFRFNKRKKNTEWAKLSAWLKQFPEVEYVEPDYILNKMATTNALPNDPYLMYQWPLTDAISGIRADQAWNSSNGAGSVVAVLDTGILPHVDLLPNLLPGYDMINDSFVANDGNGRDADPTDTGDYLLAGECGSSANTSSSWHGTHVTGTIAAAANNAEGIAGIAYASKALPVRVLGKCGGYTSDIAAGIVWAAGGSVSGVPANPNPARVINLSLGGASSCGSTLQNAINTARNNQAVVVVAAGNSNTDVSQFSPANCAGVVTVAATGKNGGKAYYSNYGNLVDLAAPGGSMNTGTADGIVSTLNSGTQQAVTDTYRYYQGTSMATPHVAGVAALMLAANPALTPDQVESLLKSSARAFPQSCNGCGTGLLDANAAVQAAKGITTTPTPVDPYTTLLNDLRKHRDLWRSLGISNYRYDLEYQSALRLQLTIKSGKVVAGINLNTNKSLTSRELRNYGKTIEQLFSSIETAIINKYPVVEANYDSVSGYPDTVFLDKNSRSQRDDVRFAASNLSKL